MVIVHIAHTENMPFWGVDVAVEAHIKRQQQLESVALINVAGHKIECVQNQFDYSKGFDIKKLPAPFNNPDLVVFHEVYRVQYLKIAKNLLKNKVPYIIVAHGSLTKNAQSKSRIKKIIGNVLFFNKFIKKAQAIQCLSKRELEQTKKLKKKFISTNGIDIPKEFKKHFNTDCTDIVFIGRYDIYYKGLDIFFDAVKSLESFINKQNVKISMYGPDDSNCFKQVEDLIKQKGVEKLITQNSAITGEQKKDRLLKSDIFIQTSRSEGMPLGIIEALSYGVPCLVTEGTNLGEIISEYNAGWVAKTTADDIAKTIRKAVLEKQEYTEKSSNAINLVKDNFVWNKVIEDEFDNYRKIINGNK